MYYINAYNVTAAKIAVYSLPEMDADPLPTVMTTVTVPVFGSFGSLSAAVTLSVYEDLTALTSVLATVMTPISLDFVMVKSLLSSPLATTNKHY